MVSLPCPFCRAAIRNILKPHGVIFDHPDCPLCAEPVSGSDVYLFHPCCHTLAACCIARFVPDSSPEAATPSIPTAPPPPPYLPFLPYGHPGIPPPPPPPMTGQAPFPFIQVPAAVPASIPDVYGGMPPPLSSAGQPPLPPPPVIPTIPPTASPDFPNAYGGIPPPHPILNSPPPPVMPSSAPPPILNVPFIWMGKEVQWSMPTRYIDGCIALVYSVGGGLVKMGSWSSAPPSPAGYNAFWRSPSTRANSRWVLMSA